MIYDSLFLPAGGGMIRDPAPVQIAPNTAAVCIGIGGLGMDALSNLRGKIYGQLQPDNPGDLVPRYNRIQLLGIDAEEYPHHRYHGNCRLSDDEFFCIRNDYLSRIFMDPRGADLIKNNPTLNWFEIDKIDRLHVPYHVCGIRQVGRYLLMNKAMDLYQTIQHKCQVALYHAGYSPLDVHIFAGLSGGTGSGCFLDVCYLIQKMAESHGWNIKITGHFFLPDVIISKPEVINQIATVNYNNSNGYAALKELDYLMHLNTSGGWFTQDYSPGLRVHTQQPPVDLCHLISATKEDGTVPENGYDMFVDLASESVMAALTGTMPPAPVHAATPYYMLGTASAEIPTREIDTYLAAGFFQKFRKLAYNPNVTITKSDIIALMEELRLNAKHVWNPLVSGSPALELPHYDNPREVAQMCPIPGGRAPERWASAGNEWLAICEGTMRCNLEALTKDLEDYNIYTINNQSLIGRLFQKLWNLSLDPKYGPYYAAALLSNHGENLLAALEGEIAIADVYARDQRIQIPPIEEHKEYCSTKLAQSNLFNRSRAYHNYYHACETHYLTYNAIKQCTMTKDALRRFRGQVEELYKNFFRPLCDMLDNLMETFQENESYLRLPYDHRHQMVTLEELKPRLDTVIDQLSPQQIVSDFIRELLQDPQGWLDRHELKINQQINQYMRNLFASEHNRTMTDYLFEASQQHIPHGHVHQLADMLEHTTLPALHDRSKPRFWCVPTFDLWTLMESSNLSVPQSCPAACMAANQFTAHVCQTALANRIRSLRQWRGIPLAAYMGLRRMKDTYDMLSQYSVSAGSHLYANTHRGDSVDWRKTLPELISEP